MMPSPFSKPSDGVFGGVTPDRCIYIVVGACPRAELEDRPTAYGLQREIHTVMARLKGPGMGGWQALVLTDLWYLNQDELRLCPTVSVGGPGSNALSAALLATIPEALSINDTLAVHVDPTGGDATAVCWGVDAATTHRATSLFAERYLEAFIRSAALA